jgi:hypothetical protein
MKIQALLFGARSSVVVEGLCYKVAGSIPDEVIYSFEIT